MRVKNTLINKAVDFGTALTGSAAAVTDTIILVPDAGPQQAWPVIYALGALLIKEMARIAFEFLKGKYAKKLAKKNK